jgi:hypothetical protein
MLFTNLLRVKKIFTKSNGETVIDLISSTFSFEKTGNSTQGIIRVKEEEIMRPDLIAERIYTNQSLFAELLKYNGISNPFSVNENDILIIPPFKNLEKATVPPKAILEKGQARLKSNEEELLAPSTVKDKKRLDSLKDKVKEIVPPNVNTEGNKNVKVKDGKVIFGEDVTQINKDNCPVPISRARLIQQLTKSNLF